MPRHVTALSDRLIRLEWHPEGRFDDRRSFVAYEPRQPGLAMSVLDEDGWTVHRTGAVEIRLRGDGPLTADSCAARFPVAGATGAWRPGMAPIGALGGTTRTLDGTAGDPPVTPGILSADGWAVVDDSRTVRLGADGWAEPGGEQGQDLYLFLHGHDFAGALADVIALSGRPPLPPRAVLGVWWSRYWKYSDADLQGIVGEFRQHGFPLDVLVMDMDWHLAKDWTGYTWNPALFPDPAGFLAWCHDQGLKTTLNLHPAGGVMAFDEQYQAFAAALGRPADGSPVPFRSSDRAYMREYFRQLHHPREAEGVDFWWMDWQQGTVTELPGLDALPWLNHLHHLDHARGDRRGVMLSRWGGLGGHRYPIQFSGDTHTKWETLASQVDFTAGSCASLAGWWSHDIGGHLQACPPELFARWVQWGAWSPALRLHSSNSPDMERRPWAYGPAVREACRTAVAQRSRYLPEWIKAAHRFHATGIAPLTPMWFTAPADPAAQAARSQAMLGEDLLIAPIVAPMADGVASRLVWLPAGAWWDVQTGERHAGGMVTVTGGLDRVPVFARAGAVLGIAPYDRTALTALDPLRLDIELWPGDGEGEIVEDAGEGDGWARGEVARTAVHQRWTADRLEIAIAPTIGRFPGLPAMRPVSVVVRGCGRPAAVDGAAWEWADGALILHLPSAALDQARTVTVTGIAAAPAPSAAGATIPRAVFSPRYDRRLAQVRYADAILIPPAAGARAVITWHAEQETVREQRCDLGELRAATVIPCPFAWRTDRGSARWWAEVAWTWDGGSRTDRGACAWDLFCGIGEWAVSVVDGPLPDPIALDPAVPVAGGTPWQDHSYRRIRHEALLDGPHLWCDSDLAARLGADASNAYAPDGKPLPVDPATLRRTHLAAVSDLVVDHAVRAAFRISGFAEGWRSALDGVPLQLDEKQRSAVLDLAPGRHRLAVVLDTVDVPKAKRYMRMLSAIAFAEDGRPLTGLGDAVPVA